MGRLETIQRAVNRSFYWSANGPVLSLYISGPLTLFEIPLSVINMIKDHRWAQIANPLISETNFFTSGLAVQLTFKNVSGPVIEANFFGQSADTQE